MPDASKPEEEEKDELEQAEDNESFAAVNPFTTLKKQYDEMVTMGEIAQLKVSMPHAFVWPLLMDLPWRIIHHMKECLMQNVTQCTQHQGKGL